MEEGLKTVRMSEEERLAAIGTQLVQVDVTTKDPDTAFLIELVGGIIGLLGIGYIYSGLTNAGLVRLVGLIAIWVLFSTVSSITMGLGFCFAPVLWIAQVFVAYISASDLKKSLVAAKSGSASGPATGGFDTGPQGPSTPTGSDQEEQM